jgi:hypothetical protein
MLYRRQSRPPAARGGTEQAGPHGPAAGGCPLTVLLQARPRAVEQRQQIADLAEQRSRMPAPAPVQFMMQEEAPPRLGDQAPEIIESLGGFLGEADAANMSAARRNFLPALLPMITQASDDILSWTLMPGAESLGPLRGVWAVLSAGNGPDEDQLGERADLLESVDVWVQEHQALLVRVNEARGTLDRVEARLIAAEFEAAFAPDSFEATYGISAERRDFERGRIAELVRLAAGLAERLADDVLAGQSLGVQIINRPVQPVAEEWGPFVGGNPPGAGQ